MSKSVVRFKRFTRISEEPADALRFAFNIKKRYGRMARVFAAKRPEVDHEVNPWGPSLSYEAPSPPGIQRRGIVKLIPERFKASKAFWKAVREILNEKLQKAFAG